MCLCVWELATLQTEKIKWSDASDENINNKMKRGILWVSVIININYHRDLAPRNLTMRQILLWLIPPLLNNTSSHYFFCSYPGRQSVRRKDPGFSSGEFILFSHNINQYWARGAPASLNSLMETWEEPQLPQMLSECHVAHKLKCYSDT